MPASSSYNRKSLISGNEWKNHLDCVLNQIHHTLHKIHNQMQHNFWFRIPNSNGKVTLNSAWNQIWCKHAELNLTSIIWDKHCAPKMSICDLLARVNKLNTKNKISRWNTHINQSCML